MQSRFLRSLALSVGCASLTAAVPAFAQTTKPAADAAPQRQDQPNEQPGVGGEVRHDGERDGRREGGREGMREGGREGRGGFEGGPRPDGGGGVDMERPPAPPQGDAEEWDKAMAFMKENSPKRWAMLPDLPEFYRQGIQDRMYGRYRQLERWKNADKEMYEIDMRRVALEDELWTARMKVRMSGEPLKPEEVSKIREKVAAFVDLAMEERELRIQRLRDVLKREEAFFANEKAQREQLVSENTTLIERGERGGFLSGGGGGGGGFGGPGRGGFPPGRNPGGPPGDRPAPGPRPTP
jgi:hypothetical protein